MDPSDLTPRRWSDLRYKLSKGEDISFSPANIEDQARWNYARQLHAVYVGDMNEYAKLKGLAKEIDHPMLHIATKIFEIDSATEFFDYYENEDIENSVLKTNWFWRFEINYQYFSWQSRIGNLNRGLEWELQAIEESIQIDNPRNALFLLFRVTYPYDRKNDIHGYEKTLNKAKDLIAKTNYTYFLFHYHFNQGKLNLKIGDYPQARQDFIEALKKNETETSIEAHYCISELAYVCRWLGHYEESLHYRKQGKESLLRAGRQLESIDMNWFLFRELENCLWFGRMDEFKSILPRVKVKVDFFVPWNNLISAWYHTLSDTTEESQELDLKQEPVQSDVMFFLSHGISLLREIRFKNSTHILDRINEIQQQPINSMEPRRKILLDWLRLMALWQTDTYEAKIKQIRILIRNTNTLNLYGLEKIYLQLLQYLGTATKQERTRLNKLSQKDKSPAPQWEKIWPYNQLRTSLNSLRVGAKSLIVNEAYEIPLPRSQVQRFLLKSLCNRINGVEYAELVKDTWQEEYQGDYHREKLRRLISRLRKHLVQNGLPDTVVQSLPGFGFGLKLGGQESPQSRQGKLIEYLNGLGKDDSFTSAELAMFMGYGSRQAQSDIKALRENGLVESINTSNPRKYKKAS